MKKGFHAKFICLGLVCLMSFSLYSAETNKYLDFPLEDLLKINIDKLINIPVKSSSKTKQPLFKTKSAIYVVTQDDIKRIGARDIPSALKIVPGLHIAQGESSSWEVSSRGFGVGPHANKLLVLIDGRSIYTATAGSVNWALSDVLIDDIKHIEVIRGPGSALWGANAVNGVINIVTFSSKETQGGILQTGGGNLGQEINLRYGFQIDDNIHIRLYDKQRWFNGFEAEDRDWRMNQGGFRIDYDIDKNHLLTLQGDHWNADISNFANKPGLPQLTEMQGGNILLRLNAKHSQHSETSYQFYYDRQESFILLHQRDTYDLDIQHSFEPQDKHHFISGFNARLSKGHFQNEPAFPLYIKDDKNYIVSAFIQDTIKLSKRFTLTLGAKFEYNDYTRLEFQPSIRLFYDRENWALWAAYSRAAKTPSALDNSSFHNVFPFVGISAQNLDSEYLNSYELGYRQKFSKYFSVDTTLFYNHYDNLRSLDLTDSSPTTDPFYNAWFGPTSSAHYKNNAQAEIFGAELAFNWFINDKWRLHGSYSFAKFNFNGEPTLESEDDHPEHMANIQSFVNINKDLQWNTTAYFYDITSGRQAASNIRLDTGFIYKISENWEASFNVKNILNHYTKESETFIQPIAYEVPRSFYISVKFKF